MKFVCFKYNTRLKNFRDGEALQEYNSILNSYVALSIKGLQLGLPDGRYFTGNSAEAAILKISA